MNYRFASIFTVFALLIGFHAEARTRTRTLINPDVKLNRYLKMRQSMRTSVQVTPYAGVNAIGYQDSTAQFDGDDQRYKANPLPGSSVGILFDYNTSIRSLGLQTGLAYHQFISEATLQDQDVERSFQHKDSYMSLPIAVKLYPFSKAGRGFFFKGGVAINALTDSREVIGEKSSNSAESSNGQTVKEERNSIDVQGILGLGIVFKLSKKLGLLFEGNFHSGLSDNRRNPEAGDSELKTQGYSGFVGLSFKL